MGERCSEDVLDLKTSQCVGSGAGFFAGMRTHLIGNSPKLELLLFSDAVCLIRPSGTGQ